MGIVRVQRVEKEIRQIVATALLDGFKEPLSGFVSVTRAVVSKDLRNAKVFLSFIDADDIDGDLKKIQFRAPDIQQRINRSLRMKFCPKVIFYKDPSYETQLKVEALLKEISDKNKLDS